MGIFNKYDQLAVFVVPAFVHGYSDTERSHRDYFSTVGAYMNIQIIYKVHDLGAGLYFGGLLNNRENSAGLRLVISLGNKT